VCGCAYVCLLNTTVSPTETDEPIEMLFGVRTRLGPRNYETGGPKSPQGKGQLWMAPPALRPFVKIL